MPKMKYRRPLWIILGSVFFIFLLGGSAVVRTLVRYSTRHEKACRQCHPEIFSLWKESKGHPFQETSCFACHANPHATVPPGYLADDDLTSKRCLDCHQEVLNLGYTIVKKVIKFNHRTHFHEGLDCVDCHRSAGHEYQTEGTNRPSIQHCQDCHMREFQGPPINQKCLNCHEVLLVPGKRGM